ncbi:hypothetical protein [Paraburkholderia sp. C35]|uniref:hypothetical protein n=1 Tax=Paraburkholderia sp. C35 TaxID=2126993 RepID=UPI000D68B412|nr:hypothetical protein [Paraburkholderia sp. C35]
MFDIDEYRKRKSRASTDYGAKMAKRDPEGFDGQSTVYRGNLYVHIDDDGKVDYDIVKATRQDAPALVMACLIMAMKLTQLIGEEHP